MFVVLTNRKLGCPLTSVFAIFVRMLVSSLFLNGHTLASKFFNRRDASSAAFPKPTMSGTFSVPPRYCRALAAVRSCISKSFWELLKAPYFREALPEHLPHMEGRQSVLCEPPNTSESLDDN